jgi:hypothetical protein
MSPVLRSVPLLQTIREIIHTVGEDLRCFVCPGLLPALRSTNGLHRIRSSHRTDSGRQITLDGAEQSRIVL